MMKTASATPFTPSFNVMPNNQLGDGIDFNDKPFLSSFPYVAPPHDPLSRRGHRRQDGDLRECIVGDGDDDDDDDDDLRIPIDESDEAAPTSARISLVGGNPSDEMAFEFSVPVDAYVTLKVYDVQGRMMRTLVDQPAAPARYARLGTDARRRRGPSKGITSFVSPPMAKSPGPGRSCSSKARFSPAAQRRAGSAGPLRWALTRKPLRQHEGRTARNTHWSVPAAMGRGPQRAGPRIRFADRPPPCRRIAATRPRARPGEAWAAASGRVHDRELRTIRENQAPARRRVSASRCAWRRNQPR